MLLSSSAQWRLTAVRNDEEEKKRRKKESNISVAVLFVIQTLVANTL